MERESADIIFNDNFAEITGMLNFNNVTAIYQKSLHFLQDKKEVTFDFAKVTATNSAGLALLIEWVKYAKQHKKKITFENLNPHLIAIAKLGGVDQLLTTT